MFENKEHEEIMKFNEKMFDFIVKFMFILMIIMMLFIVACVFILESFITDAVAEEMYVIVSDESYLNVRQNPKKDSEVVGYLTFAEQVNVDSISDGWAYMTGLGFESSVGYSRSCYLSKNKPTKIDKDAIVVSDGRVALRESPNGEKKKWLKNGESVHVEFEVDGFYMLSNKMFASKDFIEVFEKSGQNELQVFTVEND